MSQLHLGGSVNHILKSPSSVPVSTQITHAKLGLKVEMSLMGTDNFFLVAARKKWVSYKRYPLNFSHLSFLKVKKDISPQLSESCQLPASNIK